MKIVPSRHALERLKLFNIRLSDAMEMFYSGIDEKASHSRMKEQKYNGNRGVKYRNYSNILFTYRISKKDAQGKPTDPYVFIITVTNKLINLRHMPLEG